MFCMEYPFVVHVSAYTRKRNGNVEYVREHWRSYQAR